MTDEPEREYVEHDVAVAMLPDSNEIHTFRNPAGMLVGADWDRADIIEKLETHKALLTTGMAKSMGHGLIIFDGSDLFIETITPQAEDEKESEGEK